MTLDCPNCKRAGVELADHGQDCYLGQCPQCHWHVEYVVTDDQTGSFSVSSYSPDEDGQ
jgi:hypothetical protein